MYLSGKYKEALICLSRVPEWNVCKQRETNSEDSYSYHNKLQTEAYTNPMKQNIHVTYLIKT